MIDRQALAAREDEILDAARIVLRGEGLSGLTMEKIAARVPYSKGTVYGQFKCREDIFLALCSAEGRDLLALFQRAVAFRASTRLRLSLVGMAYLMFVLRNDNSFSLLSCAKTTPSILERASPSRVSEFLEIEQETLKSLGRVVDEAIRNGELRDDLQLSVERICFAMWSGSYGVISLLIGDPDSRGSMPGMRGGLSMVRELHTQNALLFDGLGWQATRGEHDEVTDLVQALPQVYAGELRDLKLRGIDLVELLKG